MSCDQYNALQNRGIRQYAPTTFEDLLAYRDGKDIIAAEAWAKKHRLHRVDSQYFEVYSMDNAFEQIVNNYLFDDLNKLYYPYFDNPLSPNEPTGSAQELDDNENSIADQGENSDIAGDFEITAIDDNISII